MTDEQEIFRVMPPAGVRFGLDEERLVYDFFIVALDRENGERIGGAPVDGAATPHIKINVKPLMFVMSYVQEVDPDPDTFAAGLAEDMALTFSADVYGKRESSEEWRLMAEGRLPGVQ